MIDFLIVLQLLRDLLGTNEIEILLYTREGSPYVRFTLERKYHYEASIRMTLTPNKYIAGMVAHHLRSLKNGVENPPPSLN